MATVAPGIISIYINFHRKMNIFVMDLISEKPKISQKFQKGRHFTFYYLEVGYKPFPKAVTGKEMELPCLI